MAFVLADVGAAMLLNAALNNVWPTGGKDLTLKLFVSDTNPADTNVAGDFTEASGGDYSTKTLSNGSWVVADAAGIQTASYAEQTFTFNGALSGGASIYGYYVVDADGVLVCAGRLDETFTPANNGDTLKVTPKVQMSKGTAT